MFAVGNTSAVDIIDKIACWSDAMTQTNYDSEKAMPILIPSELIETARKQIESLLEVQKELMQTLEGINHDVFSRAKKEADIASEFVGKLASARSIPDATTTYQEWATKEMELLAAAGRHMFEHGGKIMQASRRLFSNGGHSAGA
jgi:hypothetical protein